MPEVTAAVPPPQRLTPEAAQCPGHLSHPVWVLAVFIRGFSSWVGQLALSKHVTSAAGEPGAQGETLGLALAGRGLSIPVTTTKKQRPGRLG